MAIGTGRAIPFVISTLSCALAVPPNESPRNASNASPTRRHEKTLALTAPNITTPIDCVLLICSRAPRSDRSYLLNVGPERHDQVPIECGLRRRFRQRRCAPHGVLDRALHCVVGIAMARVDLRVEHVARRQLHDPDHALEPRLHAEWL